MIDKIGSSEELGLVIHLKLYNMAPPWVSFYVPLMALGRTGDVAQVVEYLPSTQEAIGLIPNYSNLRI